MSPRSSQQIRRRFPGDPCPQIMHRHGQAVHSRRRDLPRRGAVVRARSGSAERSELPGTGHQAQRAPWVSRNSPVSVNVAASIWARIASAASAGEVGALGPPIAVRTQPGWATIDRIWSSRSSNAIERAIMLSAALDTRYARWSGAVVLLIEPRTDEM